MLRLETGGDFSVRDSGDTTLKSGDATGVVMGSGDITSSGFTGDIASSGFKDKEACASTFGLISVFCSS